MRNMETELKIEKIVFGGQGLARNDGKVWFVPDVLAGERVLAIAESEKSNFIRARLVKVLTPSPDRIEPLCPYTTDCGGCQYNHMTYEEELRWKNRQVTEMLKHYIGVSEEVTRPIIHPKTEFRYRNDLTLHARKTETGADFGFISKDNRTILNIEDCLLADEKLKPLFDQNSTFSKGRNRAVFRLDQEDKIISNDEQFQVKVGDFSFWSRTDSFFQNNLALCSKIGDQLRSWVEEAKPTRFLDVYSGSGVFSILAAGGIQEIHCFEENLVSTSLLEKNFGINLRPLSGIHTGRAESTLPRFLKKPFHGNNFLFVDPPRQGLSPSLSAFLSRQRGIQTFAYLSCNLATLVRDLKQLTAKKNFVIQTIQPFDMFPRTQHIEVLVLLKHIQ